jgi:hypothetical protein
MLPGLLEGSGTVALGLSIEAAAEKQEIKGSLSCIPFSSLMISELFIV